MTLYERCSLCCICDMKMRQGQSYIAFPALESLSFDPADHFLRDVVSSIIDPGLHSLM